MLVLYAARVHSKIIIIVIVIIMRCFGSFLCLCWELAVHHARRGSNSSLRGLMHPNDDAFVQSVPSRPCICVSSCQQRE